MKGAIIRLAVVAGLFLCWLGYLTYLVVITPGDPVLLCRPQFLVSEVDVIAKIDDPNQPVTIEEVLFPAAGLDSLVGKKIQIKMPVKFLSFCVKNFVTLRKKIKNYNYKFIYY